jgi:Tol biopolymer transport system component
VVPSHSRRRTRRPNQRLAGASPSSVTFGESLALGGRAGVARFPSWTSPGYGGDWSPDGARVAYVAATSDAIAGPVMVVPAAGGVPRRLFEPGPAAPEAGEVRWSPDGRTVYYKAHDTEGRSSFWAVSATGGAPRLLVRFPNPDRQSSRKDFAVDGRRLYFAIEDRQSDVFVAEMISK